MSFVITGTSGHLGRLIVRDLLGRGVPGTEIVAGARSLEAVRDLADAGVRTAVVDYDDPATVEAAVATGDTFVLVSGKDLVRRNVQHEQAVTAAVRAGAGRLVYTSGLRAEGNPLGFAAAHAVTEADVRGAGVPFTILRNGWYIENYAGDLAAARESGVLLSSAGDATVASVARADLAEAAGVVLTGDGHEGSTYELSGDVAWTYDDLAAAFAQVLGRDVEYRPVSAGEHLATLTSAGVPTPYAEMAVDVDAGMRAGAMSYRNGDLARLLGRPTTSLVDGLRPLV
ncbi:SDR family oxidoreductase [Cellulomonas sp. Marseille-Q8402]